MNNNASLDNTCDQDYSEFLNEYLLQTNLACNEPETHYEGKDYENYILLWCVSEFYHILHKSKKYATQKNNAVVSSLRQTEGKLSFTFIIPLTHYLHI